MKIIIRYGFDVIRNPSYLASAQVLGDDGCHTTFHSSGDSFEEARDGALTSLVGHVKSVRGKVKIPTPIVLDINDFDWENFLSKWGDIVDTKEIADASTEEEEGTLHEDTSPNPKTR